MTKWLSNPEPASVLRRLVAYGIDCVVLFAGLVLLQAALYRINPILAMQQRGAPFTAGQLHVWVFATVTLPFAVYFAATIASARQGTFGMRWLGLRVQSSDGSRVPVRAAIVRSVVLLLPFELNHTLMFHAAPPPGGEPGMVFWIGIAMVWLLIAAYVLSIVLTARRQAAHDLAAGTVVVRQTAS